MPEATGTSPIRLSQELTIFHDVAKALTSSLNLDSILQTIMEKMAEYFRPDTWSLLMVDEEKEELYFAIAVGAAAEVLAKARLKVGEGIAGWVAKHGQTLIVPDVQSDPRFSSASGPVDEVTDPFRHLCAVALETSRAGRDPVDQCQRWPERTGDVLPAGVVRLRRDFDRECAGGRKNSGTDHHRRLHRPVQRAPSAQNARNRGLSLGPLRLPVQCDLHRPRPLQAGQRLAWPPGGKPVAGGSRIPDQSAVAAIDFAFRYGGDEFVVLLPQTSKDQAVVVARRLQDSLRGGVFCSEQSLNLSVRASMGLATFPMMRRRRTTLSARRTR